MTLRLDDELHEALRLAAFQQRRAQTAIVTEALRKHLRVACEQAGNETSSEGESEQ